MFDIVSLEETNFLLQLTKHLFNFNIWKYLLYSLKQIIFWFNLLDLNKVFAFIKYMYLSLSLWWHTGVKKIPGMFNLNLSPVNIWKWYLNDPVQRSLEVYFFLKSNISKVLSPIYKKENFTSSHGTLYTTSLQGIRCKSTLDRNNNEIRITPTA